MPLADRLWVWFDANGKRALWLVAAAAVVALIAALFIWNKNQAEIKASQALSQTEVQITLSGGKRDSASDAYLKLASEYPSTQAAGRAILQAGAGLFAQGKYADAQAQFERFAREYTSSPFLPQAMLGVAASLEAQGKTDDAIKAYEAVAKNHSASPVTPQAEFAQANILQSQGKFQEAWFLFEKLARGGLNTSIGSEAGMRAEELKDKLPASVTAPTAGTPLEAATPLPAASNTPASTPAATN